MQRIPILAWLMAAGLGALALTLFLLDDDPPAPLAAPAAKAQPAPAPVETPPRPAEAPGLRTLARGEAAVQEAVERRAAVRGGTRRAATLHQLARKPGWIRFLSTWLALPEASDDAARLARLQQALEDAQGPVIRQNLIFLAALALPPGIAAPWLQALWERGGADGEDALAALAFTGDAEARAAFERLALDPAAAKVRRILDHAGDHDTLARSNSDEARAVLRSYRALECHLREPYFKIVAYLATDFGRPEAGLGVKLGWVQAEPHTPAAERRALTMWLARWPGHPGSDDMACRIAAGYASEGDLRAAARWYSRAAVLPDQDRAYGAGRTLAGLCEVDLPRDAVLALSREEGISTPNRRFFHYVWMRRTAAEEGFDAGLRAAASLAAEDPDGVIAAAWRQRFLAPRPHGLRSGVAPLAARDPLVRKDGAGPATWPPGHPGDDARWWWRDGILPGNSPKLRLHPWPEVVALDRGRLLRQLRAWEALAGLEQRTAKARGAARADLLYKQAAVLYHDRDVLYPVYGRHTYDFSGMMQGIDRRYGAMKDQGEAVRGKRERFETSSLAYVRAMRLFKQLEQEHPGYAAMDKVLFSQGMLWKRLIDYRPSGHCVYWWESAEDAERRPARELIAVFERLAQTHPDSPLTDDALAAAAYWKRKLKRRR